MRGHHYRWPCPPTDIITGRFHRTNQGRVIGVGLPSLAGPASVCVFAASPIAVGDIFVAVGRLAGGYSWPVSTVVASPERRAVSRRSARVVYTPLQACRPPLQPSASAGKRRRAIGFRCSADAGFTSPGEYIAISVRTPVFDGRCDTGSCCVYRNKCIIS